MSGFWYVLSTIFISGTNLLFTRAWVRFPSVTQVNGFHLEELPTKRDYYYRHLFEWNSSDTVGSHVYFYTCLPPCITDNRNKQNKLCHCIQNNKVSLNIKVVALIEITRFTLPECFTIHKMFWNYHIRIEIAHWVRGLRLVKGVLLHFI